MRVSARRTRDEPGRDEVGRRQQVVGRREHARPAPRGPCADRPLPELLGEMRRRHPDRAVAARRGVASNTANTSGVRTATARRHEQDARVAVRRRASGVTRSPRPSTSAGPTGEEERHVRADRRRRPGARRSASSSAPHASSAPSRAAAAVRRSATEPGRDRDPLLEPRGERRRRRPPGPARPPARAAAIARSTRLSAVGPASSPLTWSVSAPPRAGRARGSAGRRGRAARTPNGGRGTRLAAPDDRQASGSASPARAGSPGCGAAALGHDAARAAPVRGERPERLAQHEPLPDGEGLRPPIRRDARRRRARRRRVPRPRGAAAPARCGASCGARGSRPGRAARARPPRPGRGGRRRRTARPR